MNFLSRFSKKKTVEENVKKKSNESVDFKDEVVRYSLSDPNRSGEIAACGKEYLFIFFAPVEIDEKSDEKNQNLFDSLGFNYASILNGEIRNKTAFGKGTLVDLLKPFEFADEKKYECGLFKKVQAERVIIVLHDEWDAPVMFHPLKLSEKKSVEKIHEFLNKNCGGFISLGGVGYSEVGPLNLVVFNVPVKVDMINSELEKLRIFADYLS